MKKFTIAAALCATVLTSCSTYNHSMREPNTRVELTKGDFMVSEQFSAEAKTTLVFGIDWNRLFNKKTGNIQNDNAVASITNLLYQVPVIGAVLSGDKTKNYALYNIMQEHKGYDVVFYPQFETMVENPIGLGVFYRKITVKATTKLAKLKQ